MNRREETRPRELHWLWNLCHTRGHGPKEKRGLYAPQVAGSPVMNAGGTGTSWRFLAIVLGTSCSLGLGLLQPAESARAKTAAPKVDNCCCGHHGSYFSGAGGVCACGKATTRNIKYPGAELFAFGPLPQDKGEPNIPNKEPAAAEKKITPEAKGLGDEIRKALLNH